LELEGLKLIIGERLRELCEIKRLSQGEIDNRTGLLRCYISRVENGHTIPAIERLEKFARAFEVPMYQPFYGAEEPIPSVGEARLTDKNLWGDSRRDARMLNSGVISPE
jgi:transcriptional regulator with XRE-family HTH domain